MVRREQSRLRNFIRRRVPDPRDAEDILQHVFYELVEASRLLMPVEHITAWLFRVARNRITHLFRKKRPESFSATALADEDDELLQLEDLLPSPNAGPEALYARNVAASSGSAAGDQWFGLDDLSGAAARTTSVPRHRWRLRTRGNTAGTMAHRDGCERSTMEGAGQRGRNPMSVVIYSPQADL